MSNEFDFEADFGFDDDFDEKMNEFDDFDYEFENVEMRTAVMKKDKMFALLCIKTASVGAAICRVDPREDRPAVQIYDDPAAAVKWFTRSLRTSRQNGWDIVYDGLPLQG